MNEDIIPSTEQARQPEPVQDPGEQSASSHIEVMHPEDRQPEAAEPASIEPVESSDDTDTRLDESKAWDVAHASKLEREAAAADRERVRYHKEEYLYSDHDLEPTRERARERDDKAARIEAWAEILHDNPVSPEYAATRPEVSFDARTLATLEENVQQQIDSVATIEEFLNRGNLRTLIGIDGLDASLSRQEVSSLGINGTSPDQLMYELYGAPSSAKEGEAKAKWDEYRNLFSDPETTLGQLRDHYVANFRKAIIDTRRSMIGMVQASLDDVRSGRASQKPQ